MVVVSNINHVVCVDCTEGCQAIAHNCKQCDEDVIDDVDQV